MFTNRLQSEKFDKEILNNLEKFKSFEIATGYIGSEIINKFENDLIKIAKKGYCKILIGMIFHGGVSKNQKNIFKKIDKKLRKINSKSGVYIIREDYHGKIYRFNDDNHKIIYIGSSNFSYQGLSKRLECNIPIKDKDTENEGVCGEFGEFAETEKDNPCDFWVMPQQQRSKRDAKRFHSDQQHQRRQINSKQTRNKST